MWTLVLSGVRRRLAALAAVFVATMLGAALVLIAGSLFETGIRLAAPPERLDGAPLVVIGDPSYRMLDEQNSPTTDYRPYPERHRLDPAVRQTIMGVDGVAATVPVQFFSVGGPSGLLTGQNWGSSQLGPLHLTGGRAPSAADEVAVSASAAEELKVGPGDEVRLTRGGALTGYRVTGTAGEPDAPATVFFSDTEASVRSGDGRLDAIGVLPKPGTDIEDIGPRIVQKTAGVRVLTGDGRGAAEDPAVSGARTSTIVIGAVFGGIVLVVLATIVSTMIGLAVRQRAREISLLRATGATGRQARRLIVGETMTIGVAGVLAGLTLGVPLAHLLFAVLSGVGIVPAVLQLSLGPIPFLVALITTTSVVWISARIASRPARWARAIDALRDAATPRYRVGPLRWILGVVFALGTIALAVITCLMSPSLTSATSGPAVLAGSICVALLAPAVLRAGIVFLRPIARTFAGSLGALAVHNARARTAQLSTVATSIALVVGIGVGNLAAQSIQVQAEQEASIASVRADLVAQVPGGVDTSLTDRVRAIDGVVAASGFVTSGGWIERPYDPSHRDRPWAVRGVSAEGAAGVLHTRPVSGSLTQLTGDSIALPQTTAGRLGVVPGDRVLFRFGDGTSGDLRLVATFADRPGYESLLLPERLVAAHTDSRSIPQLIVTTRDGGDGRARDAVMAALSGLPGVSIGGRDAVEAVFQQGIGIQGMINSLLVAIVVAYAAIAVVNTLGVSVLARRREFALLRLAGATRRQVGRILSTEMIIVTVTGVIAGLIVSAAAVLPTAMAVSGELLRPGPVFTLLGLLVVVILLVAPVTVAIGRRAIAPAPADALSTTG
ncbi:MAG: ABC transporter permease [Hamadaea sp.]|nr:ABC transporter permease [Hamadaea sp.]